MVIHLCCSVDAGYFLKRLKEEYPKEKLIAYFYDPNIHPFLEFKLRSLDTKRICKKLDVEFYEGEYDYISWLNAVRGKEDEPEKGKRCLVCFEHSLTKTAEFAKKMNEKTITTSLLMSPKKSKEQLQSLAKKIKEKYKVEFKVFDFRKNKGTQAQQKFAKDYQLYRQDYCGCLYAIVKQKQNQQIIDELISPLTKQILPSSIEEKLDLYKKRIELEEKNIGYKIIKENFLNYRLLRGSVKCKVKSEKWEVIDSYILFYSYLQRPARGVIEFIKDEVGYFNRMLIIFITINKFNKILNKKYQNVKELLSLPVSIKEELKVREAITNTFYSLSPIIVVDSFLNYKYEIDIEAKIYPDVREILIKF